MKLKTMLVVLLTVLVSSVYAQSTTNPYLGSWKQSYEVHYTLQTLTWEFQEGVATFESKAVSLDKGTPFFTDTSYYSYNVGAIDPVTKVAPMDVTAVKREVTIYDPEFIQFKYCGLSDWKLNETRDISGLSCDGSKPMNTHWQWFTIIQLKGSRINIGSANENADCQNTRNSLSGFRHLRQLQEKNSS